MLQSLIWSNRTLTLKMGFILNLLFLIALGKTFWLVGCTHDFFKLKYFVRFLVLSRFDFCVFPSSYFDFFHVLWVLSWFEAIFWDGCGFCGSGRSSSGRSSGRVYCRIKAAQAPDFHLTRPFQSSIPSPSSSSLSPTLSLSQLEQTLRSTGPSWTLGQQQLSPWDRCSCIMH